MFSNLLRSQRFAPLFWCQFFSSFNDNFVRQMLAMIILFRMGEAMAGPLIMLAVSLFILPSLFLSGLGGELADSRDKAWLAQRLKLAEIGVQMIAAAGFWFASLPLLFTALFGLGVIAALFGPLKYGIPTSQGGLEYLWFDASHFTRAEIGSTLVGWRASRELVLDGWSDCCFAHADHRQNPDGRHY